MMTMTKSHQKVLKSFLRRRRRHLRARLKRRKKIRRKSKRISQRKKKSQRIKTAKRARKALQRSLRGRLSSLKMTTVQSQRDGLLLLQP